MNADKNGRGWPQRGAKGAKRGLVLAAVLWGVGVGAAEHGTHAVPGEEKSAKTKVLEAGAELLQREAPLRRIHAHVCGFHAYSGDMQRQVRADHYCAHLNDEVRQCVIYDSDKEDARLIGIEYIISERLFRELPEEEKKLWHSHRHEVKSGLLVAPGLPDVAENELMEELVTTYGKTWHTWQVDRGDKLPLGVPQLMMSFTEDGQVNEAMVRARDEDVGVNTAEKRKAREKIPTREIAPGADAWQRGEAIQLRAEKVSPAGTDGTAGRSGKMLRYLAW